MSHISSPGSFPAEEMHHCTLEFSTDPAVISATNVAPGRLVPWLPNQPVGSLTGSAPRGPTDGLPAAASPAFSAGQIFNSCFPRRCDVTRSPRAQTAGPRTACVARLGSGSAQRSRGSASLSPNSSAYLLMSRERCPPVPALPNHPPMVTPPSLPLSYPYLRL